MTTLEHLQPNAALRGILPDCAVTVVNVQWFGSEALDELRAKPFYSAPADYGAAFSSHWDREGRERSMGVTLPELEKLLKDRGKVYG